MTDQPEDRVPDDTGAGGPDTSSPVAPHNKPQRQSGEQPHAARLADSTSARGRPVYLARAGYRSRRLMDGARLLPVAGLFLVIVPMLWQPADTGMPATARQAEYLFGIWGALIVVAAILSRQLSRILRDADAPEE